MAETKSRFQPKRWMIVAAIVVVLIVAVAAVVLWTPSRSHRRERGPRVPVETTAPADATSSVASTAATATVEPTAAPQPQAKPWTSSALVVFVRSGSLWTVREDGRGSARQIVPISDAATYLLSPDHRRVAYTKPKGREKPLYVTELAGGATAKVAENVDALQGFAYCWSPTSDRLAYTAPVYSGGMRVGERLYTVGADGSARRLLVDRAGSPAWGPKGTIAFRRVDMSHGAWQIDTVGASGGNVKRVPSSYQATSYDWAASKAHLAFAVTEPSARGGLSTVWVLREGETSPQPVLQEKLDQATYTRLSWSPDGGQIAVEATGDDGYSRVTIIDTSGLNSTWQVNSRRDNYLATWSADGSRLLYFEGNVFQGAPSNLWNIKRNGLSRRVIEENAAP